MFTFSKGIAAARVKCEIKLYFLVKEKFINQKLFTQSNGFDNVYPRWKLIRF